MTESMDPSYAGGDDLTEEGEIYKENILDHYKHPQNKGRLDPCDIRHREHNPVCGDRIEIFISWNDQSTAFAQLCRPRTLFDCVW